MENVEFGKHQPATQSLKVLKVIIMILSVNCHPDTMFNYIQFIFKVLCCHTLHPGFYCETVIRNVTAGDCSSETYLKKVEMVIFRLEMLQQADEL